jgi:hypothetical protein
MPEQSFAARLARAEAELPTDPRATLDAALPIACDPTAGSGAPLHARAWCLATEAVFVLQDDYRPARSLAAAMPDYAALRADPATGPRLAAAILSVSLVTAVDGATLDAARRDAFDFIRAMPAGPRRGAVFFALAFACTYRGDLAALDALLETMLAPQVAALAPPEACALEVINAMRQWLVGSFVEGRSACERALTVARTHDLGHLVPMATFQGVYSDFGLDDTAGAERRLEAARPWLGNRLDVGHYQFHRTWLLGRAGHWAKALAALEETIGIAASYGSDYQRLTSETSVAHVLAHLDRHADAERQLARIGPEVAGLGSPVMTYFLRCTDAHAALAAGREPASLAEAFTLARRHGFTLPAWWPPEDLAGLAGAALARDIEPAYLAALIRRHDLRPRDVVAALRWPHRCLVRLLGGVAIEHDGTPVDFGRKAPAQTLRLLRTLVALGGEARQDVLQDALWPEADGASAAKSLEVTVYRLRRLLGGRHCISWTAGMVRIDPDGPSIDALLVQQACRQLRGGAPPDPDTALALAEGALDLYRGPFHVDDRVPATRRFRERLDAELQAALQVVTAGAARDADTPRRRTRARALRARLTDVMAD